MDTFRTPLSPLRGVFFLNAYQRLATIGETKRVNYHFWETYNFLCKSNHVLVVISDCLCYFHPKIASVNLVKTPPKAME